MEGSGRLKSLRLLPTQPPGFFRPFVEPSLRSITLYSTIFKRYEAANSANQSRKGFRAGPHEFGHTMENDDEYLPTSPYLADTDSLMNVGQQVRKHHLHLTLDLLNTMIPGATFYV